MSNGQMIHMDFRKETSTTDAIQALFCLDASLLAMDGTTIYLSTRFKLATLYSNLLLLRKSTNSDWYCKRVSVNPDKTSWREKQQQL